MAHKLTSNQAHFLTNVDRAAALGVTTKTSQAVKYALLGGLSYCNFNGIAQPLTDEYVNGCQEYLYDCAVEASQQNNMKWAGFVE